MAVHIRLSRHGTKKAPFYRIVVTDHRARRDGRHIENIGTWNPVVQPEALVLDRARLEYWTSKGAQTSHTLTRIIRKHKQPEPAATA